MTMGLNNISALDAINNLSREIDLKSICLKILGEESVKNCEKYC